MRCDSPRLYLMRWAVLFPLVAILAAGCGKEYVHFRADDTPAAVASGWVIAGEFRLPPATGTVALALDVRGATEKKNDLKDETFEIGFQVENNGRETFALNPAEAKLVDGSNRTIAGATAYIGGRNPTGTLSIPGGRDGSGILVFQLPPSIRLDTVGSLRLILPYRVGSQTYETTGTFVRARDAEYAIGYYAGPYEEYERHTAGYYDPYYDYPYFYPYNGTFIGGHHSTHAFHGHPHHE